MTDKYREGIWINPFPDFYSGAEIFCQIWRSRMELYKIPLNNVKMEENCCYVDREITSLNFKSRCCVIDCRSGGLNIYLQNPESFLQIEMQSSSKVAVEVKATFITDKNASITLCYIVLPNIFLNIPFPLSALSSSSCFMDTFPGSLKGTVSGESIDPANIDTIKIEINTRDTTAVLSLISFSVSDRKKLGKTEVKVLDELGQYRNRNWKGKVESISCLSQILREENEKASYLPFQFPAGYSRYGGYLGKRFNAAGFFRTAFDGNRWWLVDPDGYAFFSNGICYGGRAGEFFISTGMEKFCEFLPDRSDPEFAEAWMELKGMSEYVKRNGTASAKDKYLFNYLRANMIRIFGRDWKKAWCRITARRMKQWGINTVGVGVNNYSCDPTKELIETGGIPYVFTLKDFPKTKHMIYRDFPDVFHEEFRQNCISYSGQLSGMQNDPLLIGYFLSNEPEWYFEDKICLTRNMLRSREPLASRQAWIDFVKNKYKDIMVVNEIWKSSFSDFGQLGDIRFYPEKEDGQPDRDMAEFDSMLIRKYVGIPSKILKNVDKNHLNLGIRYAFPKDIDKLGIGAEYFDVISYNHYTEDPSDALTRIGSRSNKPVMIGEFHFGAPDAGLLCTGLKTVSGQKERGIAYRYYVEQAAANPYCIGTHWFEYNDQPLLGRFDGESYQIGFVDVCNQPYTEFVSYVEATSKQIYQVMEGNVKPFSQKADFLPYK